LDEEIETLQAKVRILENKRKEVADHTAKTMEAIKTTAQNADALKRKLAATPG
jgi:uncharacterized membrane-anchored protein YhcB (DUF1043 family)